MKKGSFMTAVIGRRRVRRAGTAALLAVTAAAATTAAASAGQPAGAGTRPASPLVTTVHWGACSHGIAKPFQCATAPVPLDYHKPSGTKITLSLLRLPASDQAKRIGSLFINFGGPGGPDITDLVNRAFTVFSPAVRQRFDLVTWDPRGIEYSDPVNCFASQTASDNYYNSVPVFPYPAVGNYFSLNAQLGKDCTSHGGALLQHLATADTARDLDLLRQDVGAAKLNYLGFSYGTVIGATYANLFPGNIRAMVLDGTLDFTGNATGHKPSDATSLPVDVRQGVDKAGKSSFQRFLSLCKQAGGNCAFSGGDPSAKWSALLSRAKAGKLSYQQLMTAAYFDMEAPIADWPSLASFLQDLYTSTNAGRALPARQAAELAETARQAARASLAYAAAAKYTGNRSDAFNAIQCADSKVPTQTSVYRDLGNSEDQKVPGFGRLIVFDMMPCAAWPSSTHADVYNGPWGRSRTSILIINANHDPITPIWGARTAVSELHNARLLTVNGDGHTSMFVEPSACRDAAELAYLTSHKLPAAGATCQVDQLPFGLPGPGSR
jgi:pimeloyl-ACP methyl ester carboxylesterase